MLVGSGIFIGSSGISPMGKIKKSPLQSPSRKHGFSGSGSGSGSGFSGSQGRPQSSPFFKSSKRSHGSGFSGSSGSQGSSPIVAFFQVIKTITWFWFFWLFWLTRSSPIVAFFQVIKTITWLWFFWLFGLTFPMGAFMQIIKIIAPIRRPRSSLANFNQRLCIT